MRTTMWSTPDFSGGGSTDGAKLVAARASLAGF
jgi:hypothetical protein